MNIDERIEALVQSVELLASLHKDNERRFEERSEKTDRQIKRLGRYIHNVSELILDHEADSAPSKGKNQTTSKNKHSQPPSECSKHAPRE